MPITREADFPVEAANLMAAFNRVADGHSIETVLEASANLFAAAINTLAAARHLNDEDRERLLQQALAGLASNVRGNVRRQSKPTDIIVEGRQ